MGFKSWFWRVAQLDMKKTRILQENHYSIQAWSHLGDGVGWGHILGRKKSGVHPPWSILSSLCPFHSSFIPSWFLTNFTEHLCSRLGIEKKNYKNFHQEIQAHWRNLHKIIAIFNMQLFSALVLQNRHNIEMMFLYHPFQQHFLPPSTSSGPSSVPWVHTRLFAPRALHGVSTELNKHSLMPAFLTWKQQILHAWYSLYNFYI